MNPSDESDESNKSDDSDKSGGSWIKMARAARSVGCAHVARSVGGALGRGFFAKAEAGALVGLLPYRGRACASALLDGDSLWTTNYQQCRGVPSVRRQAMLDPWIIEQIRKREEDERGRRQPRPEVEMPYRAPHRRSDYGDSDDKTPASDRGVVIIDL